MIALQIYGLGRMKIIRKYICFDFGQLSLGLTYLFGIVFESVMDIISVICSRSEDPTSSFCSIICASTCLPSCKFLLHCSLPILMNVIVLFDYFSLLLDVEGHINRINMVLSQS